MSRGLGLCVLLAVVLSSAPALGQPVIDPPEAERPSEVEVPVEVERPRLKALILADLFSLGVGAAVTATAPPLDPGNYYSYHGTFLYTSSLVGSLASPAIHWSKGYDDAGSASLGIRLLMPPVASLVGMGVVCFPLAVAESLNEEGCGRRGAAFGYLGGYMGSMLIDYVALSRARARPERGAWYGWQVLIIDGVALALTGSALYAGYRNTGNFDLEVASILYPTLGATLGSVGSPIVHLAHRNWWNALLGAGVRFAGFLGGTGLAFMSLCAASGAAGSDDGECVRTGALTGMAIGYTAAVIFDVTVLARKPLKKKEIEAPELSLAPEDRSRVRIFPALGASREGATMGLGVQF